MLISEIEYRHQVKNFKTIKCNNEIYNGRKEKLSYSVIVDMITNAKKNPTKNPTKNLKCIKKYKYKEYAC